MRSDGRHAHSVSRMVVTPEARQKQYSESGCATRVSRALMRNSLKREIRQPVDRHALGIIFSRFEGGFRTAPCDFRTACRAICRSAQWGLRRGAVGCGGGSYTNWGWFPIQYVSLCILHVSCMYPEGYMYPECILMYLKCILHALLHSREYMYPSHCACISHVSQTSPRYILGYT